MTGGPTHSGREDFLCLDSEGTESDTYQLWGLRTWPTTPSGPTTSPVVGKGAPVGERPSSVPELYWMWNAVLAWEFLLSRFVRIAEMVPPVGPMEIWREEREPCRWSREEVE